jgi:hypothetical protein
VGPKRQVPTPLKMFDLKESYYILRRAQKDRDYQKGLKDVSITNTTKYKLEFEVIIIPTSLN